MSDDVKKVGGQPVVPPDQDAVERRDSDVPVADEAAADNYVQAEPRAESAATPSNPIFRQEDTEISLKAKALRAQMKDRKTQYFLRQGATRDYASLFARLPDGSPEIYSEVAALRELIKDPIGYIDESTIYAYSFLINKLPADSPEVYEGAAVLRELVKDSTYGAIRFYDFLAPKFADGSPEVYKGAAILRASMKAPSEDEMMSFDVFFDSCAIAEKFMENETGLDSFADALLKYYFEHNKYYNEELAEGDDGYGRPIEALDGLSERFHGLSKKGFFRAAFESGRWMDVLGLSEKAAQNLKGFAGQPRFIGFRDSVMMVLKLLSRLDDDKQVVLSRVFEATDPNKSKSVRNAVRTLRALSVLDSLPENVTQEFYESHKNLKGDTRARLRSDVEITLRVFLRDEIGRVGYDGMLLEEDAREDKDLAEKWRHAQAVQGYLSKEGLLSLFAQSASFMEEEGIEILKSLFEDLEESPVVDGELLYQKRYVRMVEWLGFAPDFVVKWSKEWSRARESSSGRVDVKETRRLVMNQASAQLAAHVNSTKGVAGEFKDLPDRLRALVTSLERGEADADEIGKLHEIMELNYRKIRETYGDLFANSRTDIKNLVAGLKKGIRVAKNAESTEVSGLVDRLAFHGIIPVETCQRLSKLYDEVTNGEGQPLNKILWGQFKMANYRIDNEVVARRMLEVTRDEDGADHLLVERLYTAGGFARLKQFDEDIVEHAHGLGIVRDRVHFLGRHQKRPVPGPLATGAMIYRDSGLPEVSPALMKPFQPIPAVAMAAMSAAIMVRPGT